MNILRPQHTVGIIGMGHFGTALAKGLWTHTEYAVKCATPEPASYENSPLAGIEVLTDNRELASQVDVLCLAVRPQDMDSVLEDIADFTGLIITFAAGLPLSYYYARVKGAQVVRAMSNLGVEYGKGMSAWVTFPAPSEELEYFISCLMTDLGEHLRVDPAEESLLDLMTALSGSGVAYLAQFFDVFKRCGVQHGLSEKEAEQTVLATVESVLAIYRQTELTLEDIIKSVASEGGTTEAGLKTMKERGLEEAIYQGLEHTISKCEDLSLR